MARTTSTHVANNLIKKDAHPVFLLEMELGSHDYHYWTGRGNAGTYKADGTILDLPEFDETYGLTAQDISLKLGFKKTWIDSTGTEREINLSDVSLYRGKTMKLMLNYETTDSTWLSNPSTDALTLFEGTITEIETYISTDESYYQVTAESQLVNLNTNKVARYSNQEQLSRFSGDVGLGYARIAQSSLLVQRGKEVPDNLYSRKIIYGEHKKNGECVFASISGSNGEFLNLVYVFADHEIQSYEQIYLDDKQVWNTGTTNYHNNFSPDGVQLVNVYTRQGYSNQTSISALTTEVGSGIWSTNHRLRGIAYIYVRLRYETETFGDEIPVCSALIKGKKVYDPRTNTTAYSDNPALCLRDFLGDSRYGLDTTLFSDAHFNSSANACDDLVQVTLNGVTTTEKKFTCSTVLDTADRPSANIRKLLSCFAGDIVYGAGVFHCFAGVSSASVVELTLDDIYSEVDSYNQNYRDVFNTATGTYVDPDINYRVEEYPPFTLGSVEETDERKLTLDLHSTSKATQCQRVAKIALKKSRQVKHLKLKCGLKVLQATAGENITLSTGMPDIDGLYKIQNLRVSFNPVSVDLDLVTTQSSDYDFGSTEYTAKPTISTEPDSSVINWVNAKLPQPTFSHTSASFTLSFNLQISFDSANHTCRYTTDGSVPTKDNSNGNTLTYTAGNNIAIPSDIVSSPSDGQILNIKALVHETNGSLQSDVASVAFTYIAPTDQIIAPISVAPSTGQNTVNRGTRRTTSSWNSGIKHRWKIPTGNVSGATTGLTLHYSTNGGSTYSTTTVNEGDTFDLPVTTISTYANLKAYLSKSGYITSVTNTATGIPFIFPEITNTSSSTYVQWRLYGAGTLYVRGSRNGATYYNTFNVGFGGVVDRWDMNYNGFILASASGSFPTATTTKYTCRAWFVTSDGRTSDTIKVQAVFASVNQTNTIQTTVSYANEGGGSG